MKDLNFGETLYSSFGVYKQRFWLYVGVTAFIALVSAILGLLFAFAIGAGLIISYAITCAKSNMFLRACRGERIRTLDTFSAFKDVKTVKRTFCACGWADLWIFIWFLIPVAGIVFAVIRYYEYAFVPYLVSERANLSATALKDESKKMTKGYKGKMFIIDLITVLAVLLVGVALFLLGLIPYVGVVFSAVLVVYAIAVVAFFPPLVNIIHAEVYLTVTGEDLPPHAGGDDGNGGDEIDEEALLASVLPTA